MYEFSPTKRLYTDGYHGTSRSEAEKIAEEGFKDTLNHDYIFFAQLRNLELAQYHGKRKAKNLNEPTYGVIQATFPARHAEFGYRGSRRRDHQIEIPVSEIGRITIVALRIYNVEEAKLILSRSIDADQ